MKLIIILIIPLITSFSLIHNNHKASKKYLIDFCDLVGYTCVDCSSISKQGENEDDEEYAKLFNGMTFKFNFSAALIMEGDDAAIFVRDISYQGKSIAIYKLVIEDEIYDVTKTR
ncbi:MAG: hypothetical protein ABR980_02250 [Ignavibacteriaceae bacterium]|jgi:hypothetical protein